MSLRKECALFTATLNNGCRVAVVAAAAAAAAAVTAEGSAPPVVNGESAAGRAPAFSPLAGKAARPT